MLYKVYYPTLTIIMENIIDIKSFSSVYQYNCHRDDFKFASLFGSFLMMLIKRAS